MSILLIIFFIIAFWHDVEQKIKVNKWTRSLNIIDLIFNIISCRVQKKKIFYWCYLQCLRTDAVAVRKGKEFICMQCLSDFTLMLRADYNVAMRSEKWNKMYSIHILLNYHYSQNVCRYIISSTNKIII